VSGFRLVAYDVPEGQAAAYYPETNPLVPLESYGDGTYTPTSKFVAIKVEKARRGTGSAAVSAMRGRFDGLVFTVAIAGQAREELHARIQRCTG
jgi:hypothetical protein